MIFIKWYCKLNENSRTINAEKLINSAETEDLKLMVRNLWWELVINISKFLSLSAFPTPFIKVVITAGMLMRGKIYSLSKEVLLSGLFWNFEIDMYLYLLIFIPPWYFQLRKFVYLNTGVCSSKWSKTPQRRKLPLVYP